MKTQILSVLGVATLCAACAAGGTGRPQSYGQKADRQNERIQDGRDSGALTDDEAAALRAQQRDVKDARRDAKQDDGTISPQEQKQLRRMQQDSSEKIYDQKHDDDTDD